MWLNRRDLASSNAMAIQIFIATAIAGVLTIMHYSLAIGFGPTIWAFLGRFSARNISKGTIGQLIQGYYLSYGSFILTISSKS